MKLTPEEGREYWDRYVTGDWWGLRTLLHNRGIDFNLDYFSETATNLSGGKDTFSGNAKNSGQAWAYTDQALFGLDLDFNKLVGWEGGSFEFYVTKRTGNNLGNVSTDFPIPVRSRMFRKSWGRGQTWRITSMWFKQTLLNDMFELKFGLMNMSQEFGGFYAIPFENLTFTAGITGQRGLLWHVHLAGESVGDGFPVERHQGFILQNWPFCFQQLLDFKQLLPSGR